MYAYMFVGVFVTTVANLDPKLGLKNDMRPYFEIIRGGGMLLTESCCRIWCAV